MAGDAQTTPDGYLLFDDTVLDTHTSFAINRVRRQYSGNAGRVRTGIGVVTCGYVNPTTDQFWLLDYRIYDPAGDGKTKLNHLCDMLTHGVQQKRLPFRAVLIDTWYANKDVLVCIERLQKV